MSMRNHSNPCKPVTTLFRCMMLLFVAIAFTGCGDSTEFTAPEPKPRPVKAITLSESGDNTTRTFPATVRAADRIDLSFEVSGKIIKLPVQEGELLDKGALVAQLDQRDFISTVNEARARFTNAKGNFNRAEDLLEKKFISPAEYDKLKSDMEVARAQMEKAEKALESTTLVTPFKGRIAVRHVENFQEILAKETIVSLQGSDFLELVVNVPERIMATVTNVREDASITAQFDALPNKQFDVTIKEYSTQADPITQTFRFVLQMPRPNEGNILPGMTATVMAKRKTEGGRIHFVLPTSAIAYNPAGEPSVWLVENNLSKRVAVTLGELIGQDKISVESGVNPGNVVIVAGTSKLREGMKVRPIDKVSF